MGYKAYSFRCSNCGAHSFVIDLAFYTKTIVPIASLETNEYYGACPFCGKEGKHNLIELMRTWNAKKILGLMNEGIMDRYWDHEFLELYGPLIPTGKRREEQYASKPDRYSEVLRLYIEFKTSEWPWNFVIRRGIKPGYVLLNYRSIKHKIRQATKNSDDLYVAVRFFLDKGFKSVPILKISHNRPACPIITFKKQDHNSLKSKEVNVEYYGKAVSGSGMPAYAVPCDYFDDFSAFIKQRVNEVGILRAR